MHIHPLYLWMDVEMKGNANTKLTTSVSVLASSVVDCGFEPQLGQAKDLGDNCIVFENFMASNGDLMVAN